MHDQARSSDRKPNSVLFSLKELRSVENQRRTQEQEQQQRQEQKRQRRQQQARRKQQEQARQKQLEQEQQQRQDQERRERQAREDQLRLQEAEQRARVEAEMELQRQRQKLELQQRAQTPGAGRWLPAVIATVVLGAVSGYMGHALHQQQLQTRATTSQLQVTRAKLRASADLLQQRARQDRALLQSQQQRYDRRIEALERKLESRGQPLASADTGSDSARDRRRGGRKVKKKGRTKTHFKLCLDSDDPLACLKRKP